MANQGNQRENRGNRDRETNSPTGTSGRRDDSGAPSDERNRPGETGNRRRNSEDDDSSLGTRNTNR